MPQGLEAKRLYQLAADQGHIVATSHLGALCRDGGYGVPKDWKEAARLFRIGADQGLATAQALEPSSALSFAEAAALAGVEPERIAALAAAKAHARAAHEAMAELVVAGRGPGRGGASLQQLFRESEAADRRLQEERPELVLEGQSQLLQVVHQVALQVAVQVIVPAVAVAVVVAVALVDQVEVVTNEQQIF